MRIKIVKITSLILITLSILYGCTANTPKKQILSHSSLEDKGIVVAKISMLTSKGQEEYLTGNAHIDGVNYPSSIVLGNLEVSLEPGMHSFNEVFVQQGLKAYAYTIKKDFEVNSGQVTNLGKILLVRSEENLGKFIAISIDNTEDMIRFLKVHKPEIYGDVDRSKFISSGKFITPSQIDKIRNQIAIMAIKDKKNLSARKKDKYIAYGGIGTIMEIDFDLTKKTIKSKNILDTGTYNKIKFCYSRKGITSCFTDSSAQQTGYVYDGKNLVRHIMPANTNFAKLYIEKDKGILYIGNDFSIYRSKDLGKSWVSNDKFQVEFDGFSKLKSIEDGDKIYVHTDKSSKVLVYSERTGEIYSLPHAKDIDTTRVLLPTRKGVFLLPVNSPFSDSKLLFLEKGTDSWKHINFSTNGCLQLNSLDDNEGKILEMKCTSGLKQITFKSIDSGESWVETNSKWL